MADMPVQNSTVTTTNLPAYIQPYVENVLQRGQAASYQPYVPYDAQRIADFTPGQTYAQQQAYDLQRPDQFGQATDLAGAAGLGALSAGQYTPASFTAQNVAAPQLQQYQMGTAQTNYNPNLQNYQMATPDQFGQAQAQQYMSPYFQNVLDVQKREAITDAQKGQLMTNLGAARQGTYGGARQLLAGTERERALGMQLGDIQAKGLQSAYENAQAQFERDRNAGFNVNKANLDSNLQTQQLGANIGAQTALANLSADQQARVQNLAAQLQTQGLSSEQALRAAMSNQQYGMDAQKAAEASRQFGTSSGLQSLAQALQSAQTLGNLGQTQQASDLARIQAQAAAGAEQQAMDQRYMDTDYADFLRQRDYPMEQLNYYNSLIRGMPMTMGSTATSYAPPPSMLSQLGGLGLGAASIYQLAK
jgi:hypothetical protein